MHPYCLWDGSKAHGNKLKTRYILLLARSHAIYSSVHEARLNSRLVQAAGRRGKNKQTNLSFQIPFIHHSCSVPSTQCPAPSSEMGLRGDRDARSPGSPGYEGPLIRTRDSVSGYISYSRKGVFYTNFRITAPEFLKPPRKYQILS